jgi:hypothetical protein
MLCAIGAPRTSSLLLTTMVHGEPSSSSFRRLRNKFSAVGA